MIIVYWLHIAFKKKIRKTLSTLFFIVPCPAMFRFVEMIRFLETNQRFTTQLYTER